MIPNQLHRTIIDQIDSMRPAEYTPPFDVSAMPVDDLTLIVVCAPAERFVVIRYDEGWDEYRIKIGTREDIENLPEFMADIDEQGTVLCCDLGAAVFGDKAKPWSQPMVQILDADGNIVGEF